MGKLKRIIKMILAGLILMITFGLIILWVITFHPADIQSEKVQLVL